MRPDVQIVSYFSIETDLAEELSSWPEFVSGQGYDVDLRSEHGDQQVSVRFVAETEAETNHVRVTGSSPGDLFDRVLGRVMHALAAHSDSLEIRRLDDRSFCP